MGIDNFKMYIDLLINILLSYGQGLFDRFLEYAKLFQNALRDSMHHMSSHQGAENMGLRTMQSLTKFQIANRIFSLLPDDSEMRKS